jgi:hypothetical protein
MTDHGAPPSGLRAPKPKGGTLIAEHVHDVATHERLLDDPDGYRPNLCPHCGGNVLHAHDYVHRRPRGAPEVPPKILLRRYLCANKECQATWRILPAFLARRLWRVWPTVERLALPTSPPTSPATPPAPIPKRTARRWRERFSARVRQLVVLLAVNGGTLLEAIAKRVGLDSTLLELVDAYALAVATPRDRMFADLAGLIHRLDRGLRLM